MKVYLFILFIILSQNIYAQNWQTLGHGVNNSVNELYSDTTDNLLYIGGRFSSSDSITTNGVAIWDGESFTPLASGLDVCNIWQCPNPIIPQTRYNDLIFFSTYVNTVDNVPINGMCTWDGIQWDAFGSFTSLNGFNANIGEILNIEEELFIFGSFQMVNEDTIFSATKWDGTIFHNLNFPLEAPNATSRISSATIFNNDIYVGGNFRSLSDPTFEDIARYDGVNWHSVGGGIKGGADDVNDMIVYNDELYICGDFRASSGNAANGIMKLKDNEWVDVGGSFLSFVQTSKMLVYNDELYVFGIFTSEAGGVSVNDVAKWNGEKWCSLGDDFNNRITSAAIYENTFYIGGAFEFINQDTFYNIAKWVGGDYIDTCGAIVTTVEKSINMESNKIKVYPNPTSNFITIEYDRVDSSNKLNLQIYNLLGQRVYSEKDIQQNQEIDINFLSSGIYWIKLFNNQNKISVVESLSIQK